MTRRPGRDWAPMFDFTRLSQAVGVLFLVYFAAIPVALAVIAVSNLAFGKGPNDIDFMWWPVPVVFPVASLVLVGDFVRRLRSGRLSTTQVTGYRAAGCFSVLGAAFASGTTWIPALVCVLLALALLAPTGGRATASTWTPP